MLTPEQKEARRLGGSTIAAALGLNRWKTPLDAYLDIRHEAPEVESNPNIERGNYLEPAIRDWSGARLGVKWATVDMPIAHPLQPWFTYSPDGIELKGPRLLEVKAPGPFSAHEWGEEGTDDIPQEYLLQGAWGLAITQQEECIFAALIGGELKIYRHVRDLALERKLINKAQAFITEHVLPGIPPPARYGDDLRVVYPKEANVPHLAWLDLNSVQQATVANYLRTTAQQAEAEQARDGAAVLVQDIIKEAPGIDGIPPELGYSRIDWKTTAPAMNAGTWKKLAERLLERAEPAEREELLKESLPTVGTRRFTPYKKKATK